MKLASALIERGNIQTELKELETRLLNNAKVQEGETPLEDPKVLLKELAEKEKRLGELITRINLTNALTKTDNVTVTELLARRDCLKQQIMITRKFLDEAGNLVSRYSRTEIVVKSTVKVSELQKELDILSKEYRLLDEEIQEMNWTIELI